MLAYGLKRVSTDAPAVSLETAKAHLRVTDIREDPYIESLLLAAQQYIEARTSRSMSRETWLYEINYFPPAIALPIEPVASVDEIQYFDADGNQQVLPEDAYEVLEIRSPKLIIPVDEWPTTDLRLGAVRIQFTTTGEFSARGQQAVLLLVGHWYENRESVSDQNLREVPMSVEALINSLRIGFYP